MANEFQNKLCVSFFAKDIHSDMQLLNKYSFCEIRLDNVSYNLEQLQSLVTVNKNIILCSKGKDTHSLIADLNNSVLSCPNYIDIDLDLFDLSILENIEIHSSTTVIFSKHYDEPLCGKHVENLVDNPLLKCGKHVEKPVDNLSLKCGKLYKYVGLSDSYADIVAIAEIVEKCNIGVDKPIVFNMGEQGRISRIYSILAGSPFGYCASDESQATASGQMRYSDMLKTLELLDK